MILQQVGRQLGQPLLGVGLAELREPSAGDQWTNTLVRRLAGRSASAHGAHEVREDVIDDLRARNLAGV